MHLTKGRSIATPLWRQSMTAVMRAPAGSLSTRNSNRTSSVIIPEETNRTGWALRVAVPCRAPVGVFLHWGAPCPGPMLPVEQQPWEPGLAGASPPGVPQGGPMGSTVPVRCFRLLSNVNPKRGANPTSRGAPEQPQPQPRTMRSLDQFRECHANSITATVAGHHEPRMHFWPGPGEMCESCPCGWTADKSA